MCPNGAIMWRHQMETFSALLALCVGNLPVTGEFPSQRPVTRSFDVFFHLCLNKRLSKQSWDWWFETPSCSLWRHCYDVPPIRYHFAKSPFLLQVGSKITVNAANIVLFSTITHSVVTSHYFLPIHRWHINHLRTELHRGNMKVYLYLISAFGIRTARIYEIHRGANKILMPRFVRVERLWGMRRHDTDLVSPEYSGSGISLSVK